MMRADIKEMIIPVYSEVELTEALRLRFEAGSLLVPNSSGMCYQDIEVHRLALVDLIEANAWSKTLDYSGQIHCRKINGKISISRINEFKLETQILKLSGQLGNVTRNSEGGSYIVNPNSIRGKHLKRLKGAKSKTRACPYCSNRIDVQALTTSICDNCMEWDVLFSQKELARKEKVLLKTAALDNELQKAIAERLTYQEQGRSHSIVETDHWYVVWKLKNHFNT